MKKYGLIIWSFVCAAVILLFTTRSSVLFLCNNWDDANSYFSMGKGMMNGLVIYRDLYDQKGPYLYLLYGIAYLISHKTFFGVFLFEIGAAMIFLFATGKYIERKSSRIVAYVLMPVVGAAAYASWSFYFGGAAEEFCLPMLAIAVYYLDVIFHDEPDDDVYRRIFAVVGVCTGIVMQIKYTLAGFFFAWILVSMIWMAGKKSFYFCVKMFGRFIVFAIIPSLPWMIYFILTGSLDDWFRCYIYNNIFHYSHVSSEEYNLFTKFYEISKTLYWLIRDSYSYFALIIAGFGLQIVMEKEIIRRISSALLFACTYVVIFIGGNKLPYYSIPLIVLAIPGAAYIGRLFQLALKKYSKEIPAAFCIAGCVAVFAASVFFAANTTMNANYRSFKKEDVWLLKAAEHLSEDDTLLELNAIDPGLYTVTGIVPTCEYFQTNGINLETMFEEQKKYLKEGRTDYVLAAQYEPEFIDEHYTLLETYEYLEKDHEEVFFLYKKR